MFTKIHENYGYFIQKSYKNYTKIMETNKQIKRHFI